MFKSFYDQTTLKTATWFFYYDAFDRLTEVRYTPDSSVATTYSLFQLVWLGQKLVAYWQTDLPSSTTSKRYVSTDEMNRPVDMMSWPASGAAARVWTINPDAWGNDTVLVGSSVFQPILFAGQYKDDETVAWQNDGITKHRPGVVLNGFRSYDPWVGSYLQLDPLVDETWSSYVYSNSNPVENIDPSGLMINLSVTVGSGLGFGFGFCSTQSTGPEGTGVVQLGNGQCDGDWQVWPTWERDGRNTGRCWVDPDCHEGEDPIPAGTWGCVTVKFLVKKDEKNCCPEYVLGSYGFYSPSREIACDRAKDDAEAELHRYNANCMIDKVVMDPGVGSCERQCAESSADLRKLTPPLRKECGRPSIPLEF